MEIIIALGIMLVIGFIGNALGGPGTPDTPVFNPNNGSWDIIPGAPGGASGCVGLVLLFGTFFVVLFMSM